MDKYKFYCPLHGKELIKDKEYEPRLGARYIDFLCEEENHVVRVLESLSNKPKIIEITIIKE